MRIGKRGLYESKQQNRQSLLTGSYRHADLSFSKTRNKNNGIIIMNTFFKKII
jgi:hypothetical protein